MIKIGARILALAVGVTAAWAYTRETANTPRTELLRLGHAPRSSIAIRTHWLPSGDAASPTWARRQFDLAIADFTRAIELDPRDARIYAIRGLAYENKGAYDLAIADYTRAIDIDPKYAAGYSGRASVYASKQQYDRAIADFTRAVELDPNDAYAYDGRGEAYHAKGAYDLAVADFSRAIDSIRNQRCTTLVEAEHI